jgi:5,5'-dehydrodivanillate O-demethylase
MLSVQQNKLLTQVGPGTPGGELMRRYWHPIGGVGELDVSPFRTKEVRLLGEDLVLFRDRSGSLGLIDRWCSHRRVNMAYGVVEDDGIRCQYHGWKFNASGACIEQPFEETVHPDGRFKEKCGIHGYQVQELSGLIWAYMGPQPAPELPRWDALVRENAVRDICITELPCNWLQCQENSLDPVHAEWLHDYFGNYVINDLMGEPDKINPAQVPLLHRRIGFDAFEHGIIKRRITQDSTEEDDAWTVGHPIIFPHVLLVGNPYVYTFQWRVPVDDLNTLHISLYTWIARPGETAPKQESVPVRMTPLFDEEGRFVLDATFNQDFMAWVCQGPTPIAERNMEKLGESDKGIILFRRMLTEQIKLVQAGKDPMNVFRDPAAADRIPLPQEHSGILGSGRIRPRYVPAEHGWSRDGAMIQQVLETWK